MEGSVVALGLHQLCAVVKLELLRLPEHGQHPLVALRTVRLARVILFL